MMVSSMSTAGGVLGPEAAADRRGRPATQPDPSQRQGGADRPLCAEAAPRGGAGACCQGRADHAEGRAKEGSGWRPPLPPTSPCAPVAPLDAAHLAGLWWTDLAAPLAPAPTI